ncbi:hypothetical protein XELAEV_18008787mg [Xenopus laevis]|uniref:Transglutaminase-like domain-containing protein n=1 Tax=Xenopus laevis TaxID=8355 RepID=A0A974DSV6_XENLA|nr:hypothetical protein XELAEV_18008787mg [Xenopus laevis]
MGHGDNIGSGGEDHERKEAVSLTISWVGGSRTRGMKRQVRSKPWHGQPTNNLTLSINQLDLYNAKTSAPHNGNLGPSDSSKPYLQGEVEQQKRSDEDMGPTQAETHKTEGKKDMFQFWSNRIKNNINPSDSKPSQDTGNVISKNRIPLPSTNGIKCGETDSNKGSVPGKAKRRKKRKEMFSSVTFTHIDNHVLNWSGQNKHQALSIQETVRGITEEARNDLEKIRAIWIWLCHNISYDVEGYLGLSQKIYQPEDVLALGKGVCSGYAGLFKEMCRELGIGCREIAGYSRATEYSDRHNFHRTKSNHMWNSVELDNDWYLLDACWGAGTVDLQEKSFIPSYDDFFFLTDPEDFIETHWPDDATWQLLETVVPFQEFEKKIFKTSEFFRLHLFIISPKVFCLQTDEGEVKVSLGCLYPTEFSYKIYKLFNNERNCVEKTHGIMTMQPAGMTLRVVPPMDGLFELMIFAKPMDSSGSYRWVCSYHIDCPESKCSQGLPHNPFHFWGLHQRAVDFGVLSLNFAGDLIVADSGFVNLTFQTSRSLLVMYELVHVQLSKALSTKCFVSHIDERQLACQLLLPFHGYYRLSLFVKDLGGDQFKTAANLLLQCHNPINHNELFPANLSMNCGPGTNSKLHGLTDPSHTSPVINTTSGKCNITFRTMADIEVYTVLENNKLRGDVHSLDRYCLITHLDHKVTISVHLPESGCYKLSILSRATGSPDFAHACDYVIRCASDHHCLSQRSSAHGDRGAPCCSLVLGFSQQISGRSLGSESLEPQRLLLLDRRRRNYS